jgi:hypothetical protein
MKKLVMNNMAEFLIIALERNKRSVLKKLSYAAYAFGQIFIENIILLELVVRIKNYKGYSVGNMVIKISGQRCKRRFGNGCGKFPYVLAPLVEINVKVFRLDEFPLKLFVLNFILAELRVNAGYEGKDKEGG